MKKIKRESSVPNFLGEIIDAPVRTLFSPSLLNDSAHSWRRQVCARNTILNYVHRHCRGIIHLARTSSRQRQKSSNDTTSLLLNPYRYTVVEENTRGSDKTLPTIFFLNFSPPRTYTTILRSRDLIEGMKGKEVGVFKNDTSVVQRVTVPMQIWRRFSPGSAALLSRSKVRERKWER